MTVPQYTNSQSLHDFQWENRILLLVDAKADSDALLKQLDELTSDRNALKERDLMIFRVTPEVFYSSDGSPVNLRAAKIYQEFGLDSGFAGTLLIGKDGGAKLKESFQVASKEIFNLIDGMPMRKAEMRADGKHWN